VFVNARANRSHWHSVRAPGAVRGNPRRAPSGPFRLPRTADPDLLTAAQRAGDPERYRRHLLYSQPEPAVSVLALVWEPGQATPIHAHGARAGGRLRG
jgi:hypothetical protein